MNYWRWLYSLTRPYAHILLISLLGSLIQSAGAGALTLLVKRVVDDVLILKDSQKLLLYVLLLFSSALVMQAGYFISSFSLAYLSEKLVMILRNKVYEKLLRVPLNYFLYSSSGDIISRIVSDLEAFKRVFGEYIPKLVREPLVALVLFFVLLFRDFVLTLFIFFLLPFMLLLTRYFSQKKKKYLARQRSEVSRLAEVLSETLRGIENIKVFLAERLFLSRFFEFSRKLFRSSLKIEFYIITNTVANYLFGYAVVALILLVGGMRILSGHISTGDFISFLTALFMIQKPIMEIQKAVMNLKGSVPLFERLLELLNLPEERDGVKEFEDLKREMRFSDVRVKVREKEILKGISFAVLRGDKVGIRGPTGSGKSTLVKLIPRLLEYEGSISVDGTELHEFRLASLRRKIGYLSQEVILFRGTVRENLLIAKPNATEQELWEALRLARCDFVKSLDMRIEEGGRNLSGGEKQRLAVARIILKDPRIIVLDEATSALDEETERQVVDALFSRFRDRTFFVVAHRPYTFRYCNLILELENGKLKGILRTQPAQ
ncbi:MAG: ABC transporter ATP-binding protein [Aquificae bacterium]|nr:ABC transporter ATP-binding protein [Aquificota bacterium]